MLPLNSDMVLYVPMRSLPVSVFVLIRILISLHSPKTHQPIHDTSTWRSHPSSTCSRKELFLQVLFASKLDKYGTYLEKTLGCPIYYPEFTQPDSHTLNTFCCSFILLNRKSMLTHIGIALTLGGYCPLSSINIA